MIIMNKIGHQSTGEFFSVSDTMFRNFFFPSVVIEDSKKNLEKEGFDKIHTHTIQLGHI